MDKATKMALVFASVLGGKGGGSGDVSAIIIHAVSHTTKAGYEVPVLTDADILRAYNGVVAGNNVFVVDDLDTITIQVLDASSIDDVSVRLLFTDKLILTYKSGGDIEATPIGGGSPNMPYSLRRLGSYLYEVTFEDMPTFVPSNPPVPSGCSAYVKDGKLYRNLDWEYSEIPSFHIVCHGFEGITFSSGSVDTELLTGEISQLPYRIMDGRNDHGIMVSTHVLYNDWGWAGSGETPLYKVPYLILSTLKSMENISQDLASILDDLAVYPMLTENEYLLQFLITDGTTTYALLPPQSASGPYVLEDITENSKLANFRWVADETVDRADLQDRPNGVERFNLMPCPLSELRFTKAYEAPTRLSEFIGMLGTTKDSTDEQLEAVYDLAHSAYLVRQRNGATWQTIHSAVYSSNGIEHLWVQEDWEKDYAGKAVPDDVTLSVNANGDLEIKDGGITAAKLNALLKALNVSTSPSNDKLITEAALAQYVASGNGGYPKALDGVDLNTVGSTGFYSCNVCTNRPTENNGAMIVIRNTVNTNTLVQIYFSYAADEMWVRHRDNSIWKNWVKVIKNGDTISYDNTISGLSATDVEGAIDELAARDLFPQVIVTSIVGASVTAKKGTTEITGTVGSEGSVKLIIPEFGSWEFKAVDDYETSIKTLVIDSVKSYDLNLPIGLIYGVEWNRTSSPVWSRTDAAELFTDPVPYMAGMEEGEYSSPFDGIYPWNSMTKMTDPVAGELVAIPKFYYKWTVTAAKMKLQISSRQQTGFHVSPAHIDRDDGAGERSVVYVGRYHCATSNYKSSSGKKPKANITRATARSAIHALGENIWQLDHAMWWTINMLYLVEFANPNCQGTIGYGRGNGSSTENMGYTDNMPYHTGSTLASKTAYGVSTQYRNIEGLWDNVLDWCDGIYFNGANVYHILNPENFSDTSGGTLTGSRSTANTVVITGFTFPNVEGFEWAGYPSSADVGAATTTGEDYFCDNYYYAANGVVLYVGGDYYQNQNYGLFFRGGDLTASNTRAIIGARLQKLH